MMTEGATGIFWPLVMAVVAVVAVAAFFLWLYGRVARKAGYPGWWSILILVPVVNLVVVWVFAFARWPLLEETPRAADPPAGG